LETTPINGEKRIFYGWFIVGVAFLCWFAADAFGWYTFGLFLGPMTSELGWTTVMMTGALTTRTIAAGLFGPLIGPLADTKYGARILMSIGVIIAGGVPFAISYVQNIWQYYLIYGVIGALGMVGYGSLVTNTIIAKWFIRKRGRAMAISTLGISLSGLAFVPLTHFLISDFGWRNTLMVLGIIVWGLTVIPVAIFVRRRPEDMGLLPDGDEPESISTKSEGLAETTNISSGERIWTLREALRTKTLWFLLVGFNLAGLSISGVMIHLIPYLLAKGFSKDVAASAMTIFALCCALVKIPWGLVSERVSVRICIIISYTGCALGILVLLASRSVPLVFIYVIIYGASMGADLVLRDLIWADYFGRTFIGTIRGVIMPANMIALACGPLFAAWLYDLTLNYQIPYIVFLITLLLGALFLYLAAPPALPRVKNPDQRSGLLLKKKP
jgi:MFS family permease